VKCQQDRSQHRNRAMAWDMLRAKLFEQEVKRREAQAEADQAAKTDIGWGHQIRSYVLQPYQMVKDLRTGVSTSNTGAVLDGDLDEFMQAALAQKAFGGGPEQVEDVEEARCGRLEWRKFAGNNSAWRSLHCGAILVRGARGRQRLKTEIKERRHEDWRVSQASPPAPRDLHAGP